MRTPKELGISQKQFNNLLTLGKFLNKKQNLPKKVKFDMNRFSDITLNEYTKTCGTTGCAVGFAPFAGIAKTKKEDWIGFTKRTLIDAGSNGFDWMFSLSWGDVDNTSKGASKRIVWFLKNGIPENYIEQMNGDNPLCYNTSHLK